MQQGCLAVGQMLPDQSSLGLWSFGSQLDPPRDYRVLLPTEQLTDGQRAGLAGAVGQLTAERTGTGLYDTILAAYKAATASWRPGEANQVVVFTDGRNEDDPVSIGLQQLATELKKAADPKRPVELTVVAYGKLPEVSMPAERDRRGGRVRVQRADAGRGVGGVPARRRLGPAHLTAAPGADAYARRVSAGPVSDVPAGLPGGAASDLVEETLTLGGHTVRLLRPRSGDALLDEVLAEDDPADDRLPFWAELWPSGSALAAAVAELDLTGRRVLELGCGLGLVSVAAAVAGADVLAADQSAEAIAFTTVNAERNGVAVRTVRCAFERPEPLLAGAPWDLVLAADVLYEPDDRAGAGRPASPCWAGRSGWPTPAGRGSRKSSRRVHAAGCPRQSRVVTPEDALPAGAHPPPAALPA